MELWARKRPINSIGQPYKFISSFENPDYSYTAIDKLDKNIYQECIILNDDNHCIMYVELDKPLVNIKRRW